MVARGVTKCSGCIDANTDCVRSKGIRGGCERCKEEKLVCFFLGGVHIFSDMGTDVAPAIDSLARKFCRKQSDSLDKLCWPLSAGFGCLHGCKCATRCFRRYVLTNGVDTFGLSDIHAIICSCSELGRWMSEHVPQTAIAFTDRHNDQYSYIVVSPALI